jgi:pimeloyl-ACP methyl ester carboxylesterase
VPQLQANNLQLEYETFGSRTDPAVVLIMGLGMQMTRWPVPLCERLQAQGYWVIRFDNRDVGRSSWIDVPVPDVMTLMQAMMTGQRARIPYTLTDMAADVVGLLDALQIHTAHLVGASMGGMIAQLVAADYSERVLSLTSVMSNSGNPAVPMAAPEVLARITTRPRDDATMADLIEHGVLTMRVMTSPHHEFEETQIRARVAADLERGYNPVGVNRQLAAVTLAGDRRAYLRRIVAPTLVLHGEDDPLFPVAAAYDLAATIPEAQLQVISGMGHELPTNLLEPIATAIVGNLRRAVPS